jgi:hypothetical protein
MTSKFEVIIVSIITSQVAMAKRESVISILNKACRRLPTEFLTLVVEKLPDLVQQDAIHAYLAAISMVGVSQCYAVLLLYGMIRSKRLNPEFIDQELKHHSPPTWARVLLENSTKMTPEIGVKAMSLTDCKGKTFAGHRTAADWEESFRSL